MELSVIEKTEKLIKKQVERNQSCLYGGEFTEKVYYWTNENVASYLDLVNFEGKDNALTVAASGDHAFSLISKGILNIDMFDINCLTEYFILGIKRSMVLKYNYFDFLMIMNSLPEYSNVKIYELIHDLLPYMEKKYAFFWKSVVDYSYKIQKTSNTDLSLIKMLFIGAYDLSDCKDNNYYLINEENYNLLKYHLSSANIKFTCVNAINLHKKFFEKYDFVLLSNILDYFSFKWGMDWEYKKLLNYEKQIENLVKQDGVLFLKYVFETSNLLFGETNISEQQFQNGEEVINLPSNITKNLSITDGPKIILKRFK